MWFRVSDCRVAVIRCTPLLVGKIWLISAVFGKRIQLHVSVSKTADGRTTAATRSTTMRTMKSDPVALPNPPASGHAKAGGRHVRAESLCLDRNLI